MSNKESHNDNLDNLDDLADSLDATDGVEVVAQVDIDNKSVQDVLVVKDSRDAQEPKGNVQDSQDETNEDESTSIKQTVDNALDEMVSKAANISKGEQGGLDDLQNAAKEVIEDVKDKVESTKQKAQDELGNLIEDAKERATDAKEKLTQNIQEIKETVEAQGTDGDAEGGLAGSLGKLGAFLSAMNGSKSTSEPYHAVDLNAKEYEQDAFRKQTSSMSAQLFGPKFTTAQSLVGKVAPSVNSDSMTNFIFNKAASWANSWAEKDLLRDSRFANLSSLTDMERDDFARDVANQNRALAVMGGLAGLAGIKGLIADAGWLLMVSLKAVYQLALIYDKPLTGKEGIKIAYGVLSGANLTRLQEKQIILTALALGNTVFANAERSSLNQELQNVGLKYSAGELFNKQFDDLSKYVNIDNLKLGWFGKLLPVTSVGVGAYYNRELIEEVLGTAMATFRPERPQLLTENQHSQEIDANEKPADKNE